MKNTVIPNIILAVLISLVSGYIIYFGFTTNYTHQVFSEKSFKHIYEKGIFRYRILSSYMLLKLDGLLEKKITDNSNTERIIQLDKDGSKHFYYAYFILNTFFLALVSIMLALTLELRSVFKLSESEKKLILAVTVILINLTQFVITPYDVSSYFFQVLIGFVFLKYFDRYFTGSMFLLCSLLFLSTLNRESSALSLSFLAMLIFLKYGWKKKTITSVALLVLSFLSAYVAVRKFYGGDGAQVLERVLIGGGYFNVQNIMGILFWITFFYLSLSLANSRENRFLIWAYHLCSLPYIITCVLSGVFFEVRLYIPLFIGAVLLSKMDTAQFKLPLSRKVFTFKGDGRPE